MAVVEVGVIFSVVVVFIFVVVLVVDVFVCTSEVIVVMAAVELGDDVAFTLVEVDVFAVSPNFDGDFDAS